MAITVFFFLPGTPISSRRPCERRGPLPRDPSVAPEVPGLRFANLPPVVMGPCFSQGTTMDFFYAAFLRWRRKRPSRRRLPLRGMEVDVADERGAAFAALQHDLAAVEGLELDAMRDADDGGFRQFLRHDIHHLVLALFVERGGGFVQHDDVRIVQNQSGEGQPLLSRRRTGFWSHGASFLDLLLEMIEPDLVQGLADLLDAPVFGGAGIGDRAAQGARGHIGAVCGSMNSRRSGWKIDAAATPTATGRRWARASVLLAGAGFPPATSSRSPGLDHHPRSPPTTAVPSSSVTERSLRLSMGLALGPRLA